MPTVELLNQKGLKVGELELNNNVFGVEDNQQAIYQTVVAERAAMRQGTQKAKNRSEVSGGGRKPWRQKGTGRARQGSIRSVQWVGGGNYGTPVPRDYSIKQNRKERRLALKSALADKANEKAIIVLDNFKVETPKTKEMMSVLENLKVADKKVLLVDLDPQGNASTGIGIDKGEIVLVSSADELRNKENASIDEIFRRCFKC